MADSALQLTLREMRSITGHPKLLAVAGLVVLIVGLSGPFQTFELLAVGPRLAYWTAMLVFTLVVGAFFGNWAVIRMRQLKLPLYVHIGLGGLSAGLPVAGVVTLVNVLTFENYEVNSWGVLTIAGYCIVISIGVSAMFALMAGQAEPSAEAHRSVKLLERIEHPKRGTLISLSVSDHYVEVVTDRGRSLLLMRLSDAIGETEGVRGLQIHRSHWVALDQVDQVLRQDGKVMIKSKVGDSFPVSRTFLPAAKAAGLTS